MCPAPAPATTSPTVALDPHRTDLTIEQGKGILMGVHRCGPDAAADLLAKTAAEHDTGIAELALATVELVRGASPTDPTATVVAMRFLMGRTAYHRPVLDGQVHPSVRDAAADMHPGPDADVERLLLSADRRDRAAEQRDHAAVDRDTAAHARPHNTPDGTALDERDREQAAIDREWAANDRDLSAGDRADILDRLRLHPPADGPAGQ